MKENNCLISSISSIINSCSKYNLSLEGSRSANESVAYPLTTYDNPCRPTIRPPLKIILFPVHRPGELISGEWVHFPPTFSRFFSPPPPPPHPQHFPHDFYTAEKNILKKKDFVASRLATIMATRWTGNKHFFRVA